MVVVVPQPGSGGTIVLTNLPDTGGLTNGMENAEGPEGVLNAIFGQVNDPSQTNQPSGDDATADTNAPASDAFLPPGKVGSRSEYDGRQSRQRRFGRPDAQRSASATDSGAPATGLGTNRGDYAFYRLIVDRNIFNPNRRPQQPFTRRDPTPVVRTTDYISLVGVMSYEEGDFAFFTGNLSRYEKSAKVDDVIATYRVVAINVNSNTVRLEGGTNRMELQVGMTMRRDEDGVWHASRTPALFASYNSTPAPGSDSSAPRGPSGGAAASADDNEVIKRLMQRREQQ